MTYDLTVDNFSTTVYKSVAADQEAAATTYLDGIGREKQKRTTDPAGDIYVETVYEICDCNGKVSKVSNPEHVYGQCLRSFGNTGRNLLGLKHGVAPFSLTLGRSA